MVPWYERPGRQYVKISLGYTVYRILVDEEIVYFDDNWSRSVFPVSSRTD